MPEELLLGKSERERERAIGRGMLEEPRRVRIFSAAFDALELLAPGSRCDPLLLLVP